MENKGANAARHKEWRRVAKKERRRRVRRRAAQERDADELRLRATLERSANYSNWLAEQEKQEMEREALEKREHDEREKSWLEEEVRAQKEWRLHQERRAKARQEKLQQEEIIRKEFEAKQEALRRKREESKRMYEEELKKHEDIQKQIEEYIENGTKTPEALRLVSESQSGKELCPFFSKTGACRYGESCSRNHRRVALSKVILIPGFYSHFSLEKNSAEYDTDISLEFESSETRKHFRDFYDEVLPELESFGRIKTLKFCCNTEIHLRGNVYVEYKSEREAARAWKKLKGRFWAGRQLNCEFVKLKSWRDALCGMNKCPKGRACNFLHTFRNPNDEYDVKSPPRWARKKEGLEGSSSSSRRSEQRSISKWDDFDRASTDESRNWRWSESPEMELNVRSKSDKTRRNIESRSERRNFEDRSDRRDIEDRSDRREIEDRSDRRNIEDRSDRRNIEDRSDRRNIEDRSDRRNIENRSDRRRSSRSERKRSIESDRSSSRASSLRSRRAEDEEEEEGFENSSRKRPKKSRKRRADSSTEDKDRSKFPKPEKSVERNNPSGKFTIASKSIGKLKSEKEESDENFDTNSKKSCGNVKKPEVEDEERMKKSPRIKCKEIDCDFTHEKKSRHKNHNFITTEDNKIAKEDSNKKLKIFTEENAWDTTDSESEEKWKKRSP